jgi:hypothetical protein
VGDRDQSSRLPAPELKWQIWYQDTFDRECPRSVEASGCGLVTGLVELWTRYLGETVRPDGSKGFSQFDLWYVSNSVKVVGKWEGAVRLRGWAFGRGRVQRGTIGRGNRHLLNKVATVHAHLIAIGQSSELILETAVAAVDRRDFEARLVRLER